MKCQYSPLPGDRLQFFLPWRVDPYHVTLGHSPHLSWTLASKVWGPRSVGELEGATVPKPWHLGPPLLSCWTEGCVQRDWGDMAGPGVQP